MIIFVLLTQVFSQCLPKQYPQDSVCLDCLFECVSCIASDICTICESYYYLNNGSCLNCHPSCLACSGDQYNQCTGCASDKRFVNGACADRNSILMGENQIQLIYTLQASTLSLQVQVQNTLLKQFVMTQNSVNPSFTIKQVPYLGLGFKLNSTVTHDLDLIMIIFDDSNTKVFDAQMDANTMSIKKDSQLNQSDNLVTQGLSVTVDTISLTVIKPLEGVQDDASIDPLINQDIYWAMGSAQQTKSGSEIYFGAAYHQMAGKVVLDFLNNQVITLGCDNCVKCTDGNCEQCFDGYYLTNGLCSQCNVICATCTSYTECISCKSIIKDAILINGKCYNYEQVYSEIRGSNITEYTADQLVKYSRLLNAYYGLEQGPTFKCSEYMCVVGTCQNGYCFCLDNSIGYFCEYSQQQKSVIQIYITNVIQLIPTNDSLIVSSILKELSYLSYTFSKDYDLSALIQFNLTYDSSENSTLYSNYGIFLLNSLEINYFNHYSNEDTNVFAKLQQLIDNALIYNIQFSAITNFGQLIVNERNNSNFVINQNLQVIPQDQNQFYYLVLLNNSLYTTIESQYITNRTSFFVQINVESQPNNQTIDVTLPRSKSAMYDEQYLMCMYLDENKKAKIINKPSTINSDNFICQINLQKDNIIFVAHYLSYLIQNITEESLWQANNKGFIACMALEGALIFGIVALYVFYSQVFNQYQNKSVKQIIKEESEFQSQQQIEVQHDLQGLQSPQQIFSPSNSQFQINHQEPFLKQENSNSYKINDDTKQQFNNEPCKSDESSNISQDIDEHHNRQTLPKMAVNEQHSENEQQEKQVDGNIEKVVSTMKISKKEDEPKIFINKPSDNIFYQEDEESKCPDQNMLPIQINSLSQIDPINIVNKQDKEENSCDNDNDDSDSSSERELQDIMSNQIPYDLWNHHPIISIYRSIKYHRDFQWQCYFLTLISMTIHIELVLLIGQYEIYIAINGSQEDIPEFIVLTLMAIIFSWVLMYLYGYISSFMKTISLDNQNNNQEETAYKIKIYYWVVYSFIILCFDFIISWRVYSYELGVPDYWLASAIFCPYNAFYITSFKTGRVIDIQIALFERISAF